MAISFFVDGIPAPGGSKRGFAFKRPNGRLGVSISDAGGKRNKTWRTCVAAFSRMAYKGEPIDVPLVYHFVFYMPRPADHFVGNDKRRELKPIAPDYHFKTPDGLKLCRSTEDAMTGIVWKDDSLVVRGTWEKRYGRKTGCQITIELASVFLKPKKILLTGAVSPAAKMGNG